MNTLQIQDAFDPYYAGRKQSDADGHPAKPARPKTTSHRDGRKAVRQVKNRLRKPGDTNDSDERN